MHVCVHHSFFCMTCVFSILCLVESSAVYSIIITERHVSKSTFHWEQNLKYSSCLRDLCAVVARATQYSLHLLYIKMQVNVSAKVMASLRSNWATLHGIDETRVKTHKRLPTIELIRGFASAPLRIGGGVDRPAPTSTKKGHRRLSKIDIIRGKAILDGVHRENGKSRSSSSASNSRQQDPSHSPPPVAVPVDFFDGAQAQVFLLVCDRHLQMFLYIKTFQGYQSEIQSLWSQRIFDTVAAIHSLAGCCGFSLHFRRCSRSRFWLVCIWETFYRRTWDFFWPTVYSMLPQPVRDLAHIRHHPSPFAIAKQLEFLRLEN